MLFLVPIIIQYFDREFIVEKISIPVYFRSHTFLREPISYHFSFVIFMRNTHRKKQEMRSLRNDLLLDKALYYTCNFVPCVYLACTLRSKTEHFSRNLRTPSPLKLLQNSVQRRAEKQ